jgi:hypothetical protein
MKVGISVECVVCGRDKFPRGRSAPIALYGSCCDDRCPGYLQEPLPGDLWPGETEKEFGFPVSANATREVKG